MFFRDALIEYGYDPSRVLALRHSLNHDPKLKELMPRLVVAEPDLFNTIQRWQFTKAVEESFQKADFIAAFLSNEKFLDGDAKRAIFAGLYKRADWEELSAAQVSQHPDALSLIELGAREKTFIPPRESILRYQLDLEPEFTQKYQGKLIIVWPNPRNWHQFVITPKDTNKFPIHAILPGNSFEGHMPPWDELVLSWLDLNFLPEAWKKRLSDWNGIYLITDKSDGKSYVGAAYGKDGLLQRWLDYKISGHGGNKALKKCNPNNFLFTILARLPSDMVENEVSRRETSWKIRLHTRELGLNEN